MSVLDDEASVHRGNGAQLLKALEVAKILGLGRTKVYEMIERGQLPVVRIGTAVRVPRKGLFDWIDGMTQPAV